MVRQSRLEFLTLLILTLMSFFSCVSAPVKVPERPSAYITDRARFVLLPPGEIESPLDMAQHIEGRWQDQKYSADAWVKADEEGLDISLFNNMGISMGDLSYKPEGKITFSSPVLPASLRPEYIVADFQLCFYRASALEAALKEAGLFLTVGKGEAIEVRTIVEDSKPIIRIEKTPSSVKYTHNQRGYSYTLEGSF